MCTLLLCFMLLGVVFYTTHAIKFPPNVSLPAVFAFGDSIMDTGNNNNIMKTFAKCNFPPYGKDFKGGIPTGRFGNGKVPSDFLVEVLGIKEFLPAYLDPNIQPNDLITGVCFASGGTGYDPLTSQLAVAISLSTQIEMFKEYIGKLKGLVGVDRANFIIENSIYLVVQGSNDISNTYFLSHVRELQYDVPAYADLMLTGAMNFLKEIYKLGARKIGVFSAPPIGCVPFQRTVAGGIERECAEKINDLCKLFNTKLSRELTSLNQNLINSRMVYLDVYTPILDIIVNYQNYGYKVGDKGCCGTGEVEASVLCNQFSTTCENANDYVFWDSFHPTESVYIKLVDSLIRKYMHQFL
ncbi:unnamed protein product [Vicia faba]|uniref:GDSL esterase/lipase EXL3 n=1 Tax=Vicia faba TaxID=3906 RepID=A0AAV0ZQC6_VICFA|nr:unnamed protein product [Vicia faba]